MTNKENVNKDIDFNKKFKGKLLLAWDETTGEYAFVSPRILTSTVYTEQGIPLDDYLVVSPKQVLDKLDEILKDAPKDYDTFKEVAKALDTNKDSIVEILREISKRVIRPQGGNTGDVLKLDENGDIVFAEDKDTIYIPPSTINASIVETDPNRRFVTDTDKENWNNKLDDNSDISNNLVVNPYTNGNGKSTLREMLKMNDKDINDLLDFMNTKGKANGLAELDRDKKIPIKQLPDEALRDTVQDLTPYAKSTDIETRYSTKRELSRAKDFINDKFSNYVESSVFDSFKIDNTKALDKKEDTINRGAVNGYASLDDKGKVPKEQLPEEAFKDTTYNLEPYALKTDIKTELSQMVEDTSHRTVSDTEKSKWNNATTDVDNIKKKMGSLADMDDLNTSQENLLLGISKKLEDKVDKVEGMGLSQNSYTNVDKEKVKNIPTKISQLQNDENLLSSLEVERLINSKSYLNKEKVNTLPSNPQENTIYLLQDKNATNNVYTEYMYINGNWEIIGDTKIDLSGYAKKTELPKKLSEMGEDSGHRTVTDIEKSKWDKVDDKADRKDLNSKVDETRLSDYLSKDEYNGSRFTIYRPNSNCNNLDYEWFLGSNGSNYPDSGFWYVNTIFYNNTNKMQVAYSYNTNLQEVYYRNCISNNWSSWKKIAKFEDIPTRLSQLQTDSNNRTVTDTEKSTWNSKITSTDVKDVKFNPGTLGSKWGSGTRQLIYWISDLKQRTEELRDSKLEAQSLTQSQYDNLTTKKPNTLYLIKAD